MTAVLTVILAVLAAAAWLWLLARIGLVAARMYQIEEYEAGRLLAWGRRRAWLLHRAVLVVAAPAAAVTVAALIDPSAAPLRPVLAAAWLAGAVVAQPAWDWLPPKKALVFTPRLRRLLATAAVLALLAGTGVCVAVELAPAWVAGLVVVAVAGGATLLAMVLLVAANILNQPAEARVRRGFLRQARRRIELVDPLVIAVAGSYGKTSTKHILAHFLEQYA
ncbi:MAG TPA: hypothetical protein VH498_00690, partial [Candidatus Dormibacteraeota bacterium]|nr:hypothetical protein [Candidatus Dormibacteraeota bacterium]